MKNVLVVDDSSSIRHMVRMALTGHNYHVEEAADGIQALASMSNRKFDLVISDVNMPNMDGIELVRQLKNNADYKFVPVLMLTTEGDARKKAEGRSAGAKAWMVKPFKPDKLINAVEQLIA